jgi:hypothetical protein
MRRERSCEDCRSPIGKHERLRPTACVDGRIRWCCEACALDQHEQVKEQQRELREFSTAKDY